MISYIILIFFTALSVLNLKRNKKIGSWIIFYYFCAPSIQIGSLKIDSSYLYIVFVLIIYIILNNGHIKRYRYIKGFILLSAVWILAYSIGWNLSGRLSLATFLSSIMGLMKTVIAIYVCFLTGSYNTKNELDNVIGKGLTYTIIANLVAVFLQWIMPLKMYSICYDLYYSATSVGYTNYELIESWGSGFFNGHYYRYFGLFEVPAMLSCFASIVLSFWIIQKIGKRKFFTHTGLVFITTIILGVSSQCKLFFLILPILLILYVFYDFRSINIKKIRSMLLIIVGVLIFIVFFDSISSVQIFRYFKYLLDPISAFGTRFSTSTENTGYISNTLNIALNNWLTGVGPVSISGEAVADSSYVALFHNGGIMTILALIIFWFQIYMQNVHSNEGYINIIVFCMLIMGLSRTTLMFGSILIVVLFYQFENNRIRNTKESGGILR